MLRRELIKSAVATFLPAVRAAHATGARTSDLRRAVDAYVRARDHCEGITVEDDDDLPVYGDALRRYDEAKEHAIELAMAALDDVQFPAAIDLDTYLVIIDYSDEDMGCGDEPEHQAVISVLPKGRIVRA